MRGKNMSTSPFLTKIGLSETEQKVYLSLLALGPLSAGEIAKDKTNKELEEVIEEEDKNPKPSERFGHDGLSERSGFRVIQRLSAMIESNEGECLTGVHAFKALEKEILDEIPDPKKREKCFEDLRVARSLYRQEVRTSLFKAYMEDKEAIKTSVKSYVNMIMALGADNLGDDKIWTYI